MQRNQFYLIVMKVWINNCIGLISDFAFAETVLKQDNLLANRKPVKAAIAATAEYISGLLPSHLVYSHAHETAVEVCCHSSIFPFVYWFHIHEFHDHSSCSSMSICLFSFMDKVLDQSKWGNVWDLVEALLFI